MTDENRMIVCVRWGAHRLDSEKVACSQCGVECAISKQAISVGEARGLKPWCIPCFTKLKERGEKIKFGGLIAGGGQVVKPGEN